ncbi:sigma factor of ECF subfamily [alpha proteobacterium U9-1i]|nr:sigma factor of ECF subfamily [alpha proteobacterium U9-1i]
MSSPPIPESSGLGSPQRAGIVARYREPLIRYFLRKGMNEPASEDLAHDTFLKLFALARTDHVENMEAYLFQIARSVFNDHLSHLEVRRRNHGIVESLWGEKTETRTPERVLEGKAAFARFESALAELKPKTRDIFLMNRMEGLSYTQIAVRLGVTPSAIEKHISTAIAHFVRRLRDHR